MVLLVDFGPVDQGTGCSWWVRKSRLTREPIKQALSQRSTALAIGQGSNALLKVCLVHMTSVGRIVFDVSFMRALYQSSEIFTPSLLRTLVNTTSSTLLVSKIAGEAAEFGSHRRRSEADVVEAHVKEAIKDEEGRVRVDVRVRFRRVEPHRGGQEEDAVWGESRQLGESLGKQCDNDSHQRSAQENDITR